jgi:hypothetical protein
MTIGEKQYGKWNSVDCELLGGLEG